MECTNQILNYGKQNQDLYGEVTVLITQAYGFLYSDIMVEYKKQFPKAELNLRKISVPSGVGTTPVGVRSNRRTPISSSK